MSTEPMSPKALSSVRSGGFRRAIGPVLLLVCWQLASSSGLISTRVLAAPTTVLDAGWALIASGELSNHLWVSLGGSRVGPCIGVSAGLGLALVSGLFRLGEDLLDPPLQVLRTLPVLALLPLFILRFGVGETPKIALVALGTSSPSGWDRSSRSIYVPSERRRRTDRADDRALA